MRFSIPFAVEAVAFFTCACQFTFETFLYEFIYQTVSEELNVTSNHSVEYCTPNGSSSSNEQRVADEASRWTMYAMLTGFISCMFGATLFTAWSDKIGRRKAIAFPVLGTLLAAIMQLVVIYYRFPLYSIIVVEIVYGGCGSYSALLNIGSAHLSDIVYPEDRGRRFNILEVAASVGGGMVQIGTGYWLTSCGFIPPSIFIIFCAFIASLFIPFMKHTEKTIKGIAERDPLLGSKYHTTNPEIDYAEVDEYSDTSAVSCNALAKQLQTSWRIYSIDQCLCEECHLISRQDFRKKKGKIHRGRLWRLWFYVISFSLYMFAVNGVSLIITMFLVSYPICFTPTLVGAQTGLNNGLIISVPFLLYLLQTRMKLEGQTILLIGILGRVIASVMMSMARGPVLVFSATGFAIIYNFSTAFMRSEASRLVSLDEQGAALAVISGFESMSNALSPVVFSMLYPATLHIFHGFTLVVAAIIYSITLLMMGTVWIANKRKVRSP